MCVSVFVWMFHSFEFGQPDILLPLECNLVNMAVVVEQWCDPAIRKIPSTAKNILTEVTKQ